MIAHVVLFEPRPDLPVEDRTRVFEDLRLAATTIPTVRRFRVGRRVRHGLPGYEAAMTASYSYAVIVEFDDRAGLEEYLRHPSHHAIGAHFVQSASQAIAYDYEVSDIENMATEAFSHP